MKTLINENTKTGKWEIINYKTSKIVKTFDTGDDAAKYETLLQICHNLRQACKVAQKCFGKNETDLMVVMLEDRKQIEEAINEASFLGDKKND